jgi:hypothetical protein
MEAKVFISDSGHGWLRVPHAELKASGVKPSPFSYFDAENAYLEEDCDAPAYIQATGETNFREINVNGESHIRDLERFRR